MAEGYDDVPIDDEPLEAGDVFDAVETIVDLAEALRNPVAAAADDPVIPLTFRSSALIAGTYRPKRSELSLLFKDGRSFRYHGVSRIVVEQLLAAPSQGAYFN